MLWSLAHFGLELNDPETIIGNSLVEVTKPLPETVSECEDPKNLLHTPADPRLDGPPSEDTLLNVFGHIVLAVPIPRPECRWEIVYEINKGRPLDHPIRKLEKKVSTSFFFDIENSGEDIKVNPEEIYSALKRLGKIVVMGTTWTSHHVETDASNMMLKVLPVPCIYASTRNGLVMKLNQIIRMNNRLKSFMEEPNVPALIVEDMIELLSYHVMTYLDNAMSGIPSDEHLELGIAQRLGEYHEFDETKLPSDLGGTTLQRIVRGINMGETVLNVNTEGNEHKFLAFELQKQLVFNRIWKSSQTSTQLIHINNFGEVRDMQVGLIDDLKWELWDGSTTFDRDVVVAPRFSNRQIHSERPASLQKRISKLQEVDNSYTPNVPEDNALSYLYGLIEQGGGVAEQQIVVCDAFMNPLLLRPILHELKQGAKTGVNFCIILTEMRDVDANTYEYTPTPDDHRNLIIALTELRERPQLKHKEKMFQHLRPTDVATLAMYVKGLMRSEIIHLMGEVILTKGKLDLEYAKACISAFLLRQGRSVEHLRPKIVKQRRKLTLERIYRDDSTSPVPELPDTNDQEEDDEDVAQGSEEDSLFSSLKGLEPLVNWAKLTGKRFTPAAAEYGFTGYPKGLLLTGVPGCGKTMAAKIIAEEWGMNLRRVNPDDITSRYVGGNEENIRAILDELVKEAPSICFVDEAEKLFIQMTGSEQTPATVGQASTESILLQFLEENDKPVFFIFTANDLHLMSPALIDRFDARFFVDLPDQPAREEIITLMLKERKKGKLGLDSSYLASISEHFTGRDIRAAINTAMVTAFGDSGRELTQEDLVEAFKNTKPTSMTHKDKIAEIRKMVAEGKVRSANSPRVVFKAASSTYDVSVG
ncbi:MAG: AAA family ATPase [Poseidonia sp.]